MRFLMARTPRSKNPPVDLARCKGEKSFPSVLTNRENWKGLWESLPLYVPFIKKIIL